jgi:hypothetical protein
MFKILNYKIFYFNFILKKILNYFNDLKIFNYYFFFDRENFWNK